MKKCAPSTLQTPSWFHGYGGKPTHRLQSLGSHTNPCHSLGSPCASGLPNQNHPRKQNSTRCFIMNRLVIVLALIGWALYGYSALRPRSSEAEAVAEITRLRQVVESTSAERDKFAETLEQLSEKNQDLQHVQKQIAAATEQLNHLEYLRARVSGEIDTARPQPIEPAEQVTGAEARSERDTTRAKPLVPPSQAFPPSETPVPAAAANTSPSKEDVRDAQEALTMLGYGQLKADGVFGPSTRQSVEAFQQAQGLAMTGRLDTATLQAIRASRSAAMR